MSPKPNNGKSAPPPRRYRSDLRRQQAEQTRRRIVAAAAELFAADGYASTTLAKIAAAAGVSAETVAGHGPKAALIRAALEYVTFGVSDEENFLQLDMGRRFLEIDDRDDAVEYLVSNQAELHERSSSLWQALVGAASSDAELDRYLGEVMAGVTLQGRRILEVVRDRGWLREDVPFDELVVTSAVLSGVDTYLRVTRREGWSMQRYRSWLRRMVTETILAP